MANNNPTVNLTYSSGGTASYTKVQSGSGWTITVTATPNSGKMVSFIRQTCDQGNDRTEKYNTPGTKTFVSTGHSACTTITIYVSFSTRSEVQCEYEYWSEVDPPEAGTPNPPELESKIVWVAPGGRTGRLSFGLNQKTGWENYEVERYGSDHEVDVIGYDPPRRGSSLSNTTHLVDGCDPDFPGYHTFCYVYKCRRRTFKVTFDPNGGQVSPVEKTVTYGLPYGSLPVPTRKIQDEPIQDALLYDARYRFDGWYTARSGGELVTQDTLFKRTSNQTLYAHWTDPFGNLVYGSGGTLLFEG